MSLFTIIIPRETPNERKIDQAIYDLLLGETEKLLADLYGGFTRSESSGCYTADSGNLICEQSYTYLIATETEDTPITEQEELSAMITLCCIIASTHEQEWVAMFHNGKMHRCYSLSGVKY